MKRLLLLSLLIAGCSAIQPIQSAANDGKFRILQPPVPLDALGISVPLQVSRGPASWRADSDTVATVDPSGRLTTVGNGRVTVHADREGETSALTLEIKQIAVSLSVVPPTLSLAGPGETKNLAVAALDRNDRPVTAGLEFKSGNEGVVVVSAKGEVSAVGSGQTEVAVSVGGRKTSVHVEVGGTAFEEPVLDGPGGQAKLNIHL